VSTGENHPYFSFFQFAIGLADYRSSEFQGAAERMRSVLAVGNLGTYLRVQALAVLAMGDEHLQNHDQARESLLQAIELSDSSLPPMDGGDLGSSWHDVLIADLLTREAKALVATNDFAPKQLARLLRSNGFLEARRGQWKQAISHIRQAIAITPTDHLPYHDLAALLVITHDLESYRKHCQDELLQFRQTRDASTAHRMAKDCLILANSGRILRWLGNGPIQVCALVRAVGASRHFCLRKLWLSTALAS